MDDDQHLCTLVALGRETRDLDYKAPAIWNSNDKKACCELVKDILALANTNGGSLVIGVDDPNTGSNLIGLTPDELKTWESTKVNNFIQSYADPTINVEIAKPICHGKQVAVILVPRFRQVPHLCIKDYPGVLTKPTLYMRSANNASEVLASAQDFQDLIEQAIRTRSGQMLESMRAILTGADVRPRPTDLEQFAQQVAAIRQAVTDPYPDQDHDAYFTSAMFPARFDAKRFSLNALRHAATETSVTYRGWPILYYRDEDPNLAVMNDGLRYEFVGRNDARQTDRHFFWDLRQSGLLVSRELLWEAGDASIRARYGRAVDPNSIIFYVTEAVAALVRLYEFLDVGGEDITLQIRLEGAHDRHLSTLDSGRFIGGSYISREAVIEVGATHPIAEWTASLREQAAMLSVEILQRFQVTGGFEVREWVDRLLDRRI